MTTGSRPSLRPSLALGLALAAVSACGAEGEPTSLQQSALADDGVQGDDHDDSEEVRRAAARTVSWASERDCHDPVAVKILGFNDFHGQLSAGRKVGTRSVGGAAVLAAYLRAAQVGREERTFIVHAGDHVGASPPASALLQDEPSIAFLNLLASPACQGRPRKDRRCNLIGTAGNHEFDEGRSELVRLLGGGNHAKGPFLQDPWPGAVYPTVSANVVLTEAGTPLLPPYVIRRAGRARIGFVGAVLKETPTIVTPSGVAGLTFQDEAEAINRAVTDLRAQGVHTIVVLIHQGGPQASYTGATNPAAAGPAGPIAEIVSRLHDDVDLVVSGHAHAFSNAILATASGKEVLVTQAFSASTGYADIDLEIDPRTGDVIRKSAAIVTTWADEGPGLNPDPQVAALVTAAEDQVAPLVNQVVGTAAAPVTRAESAAGESALGNLIADAQRAATGTQLALMNPGGIRVDLPAGPITWGTAFSVQPFGNSLVAMTLTGQDLYDLLNQQWVGAFPRLLKTSGFSYTWSEGRPAADRVVEIRDGAGAPIDRAASYTVTVNSFLASGGDGFTVLLRGTNLVGGDVDLDALIAHFARLPSPFSAAIEGRIEKVP
jgi:5'-nucleotidase